MPPGTPNPKQKYTNPGNPKNHAFSLLAAGWPVGPITLVITSVNDMRGDVHSFRMMLDLLSMVAHSYDMVVRSRPQGPGVAETNIV